MADTERTGRLLTRLQAARLPALVATAALGAAALLGQINPLAAALVWLAVVVAALFGSRPEPTPAQDAAASGAVAGSSTALLHAVLDGLPQPVIAVSVLGDVLAANAPARSMAPALRAGEPVSLALRAPELLEAIRQAIAHGTPQHVEFTERVPVERWYDATVAPVTLDAPHAAALPLVLVAIGDLTPLRRVDAMRADFVANASHELRTPLAALSGFIETLQGLARNDAAAQAKFLPIMHAQATRMARLIDDLLSLSRVELNEHRRPVTPVELGGIVRQVVDGLQTLARDRAVAVTVAAPSEPLRVLGDRDELLRVFENLIENALKYGASGERVEVTLAAEPARGEVRVAVRDYGPGIAPEHLPRLTERFYRVDVADSRAQGGTGLGLALVKHILNRHGGRLAIDSVKGAGATFTAVLPLAPSGSGA